MSVKRVFGTVDGKQIILEHDLGDRWKVLVPSDKDGKYVIELFAQDDAGNISYVAKYLYTFDSSNFATSLIPLPWQFKLLESDYTSAICIPDFTATVRGTG